MESNTIEMAAVAAAEPQPTVAVIGYVANLDAIPGADRIRLATVYCGDEGVWKGVVTLDVQADDKVLALLQDALLPESERWAFMSRHKWRVRMARFKGCPSECVILPLDSAEKEVWEIGQDVGDQLGITKYSKPVPAEMAGQAKDNFPSFIPKTDEPNFQRMRDREALMAGVEWYATEKADGTSCTAFMKDGELRVCSRNWELEDGDNLYWNAARKYELSRIPEGVALQFEIVGPSIQGNPLGLAETEIRVFTGHVFGDAMGLPLECQPGERMPYDQLVDLCFDMQIPMARLVATGRGPLTSDELQKLAEITYPNGRPGEGVVVRGLNNEFSMKAISLLYKD